MGRKSAAAAAVNDRLGLKRGSLIWAPWRRSPPWPAVVLQVYPKKLTFTWLPLQKDGTRPAFSCQPKSVFALSTGDKLPSDAESQLVAAFEEARDFLVTKNLVKNCDAPKFPGLKEKGKQMKNEKKAAEKAGTSEKAKQSESAEGVEPEYEEEEDEEVEEEDGGSEGNGEEETEKRNDVEMQDVEDEEEEGEDEEEEEKVAADGEGEGEAEQGGASAAVEFSMPLLGVPLGVAAIALAEEVLSHLPNKSTPHSARHLMEFQMEPARLLTDSEMDELVERLLSLQQTRHPEQSSLVRFHLVISMLLPAVLVEALQKTRGISREEAISSLSTSPSLPGLQDDNE